MPATPRHASSRGVVAAIPACTLAARRSPAGRTSTASPQSAIVAAHRNLDGTVSGCGASSDSPADDHDLSRDARDSCRVAL
ncbi:MAG: hypothetical protein WA603_05000, partial [Candidatus Acidiferrales bacterium]